MVSCQLQFDICVVMMMLVMLMMTMKVSGYISPIAIRIAQQKSAELENKMMITTITTCHHPVLVASSVSSRTVRTRLYDKRSDSATATSTSTSTTSKEVLASMGDWAAYLDEERTGLVYYFNGRTGESLWEPPLPNFPPVSLTPAMSTKAQLKQDEYVKEIEKQQLARQQEREQQEKMKKKQQEKQQEKSNFFTFLSDEIDETQQQEDKIAAAVSAQNKATKRAAVATRRKLKESADWFESVMQDVVLKRPTTADRLPSSDSGLANRMKSDFFDKMFSSGRNVVTSVSSVISSTVDELATIANNQTTVSNTIFPPSLVNDDDDAAATTTTTISKDTKPSKTTVTTKPTTTTTTITSPLITTKTPSEVLSPITVTTPATRTVQVVSYVLPHPDKILWGGEDAVFVSGKTFGVFDGVTGAEKRAGVPLYSKTLANEMKRRTVSYQNVGMTIPQLSQVLLESAEVADNKGTGASTAIVASITTNDGFLRVLNVGDSRCIVIRNGIVVGKSREISHFFECPYQLSSDSEDRPKDGTKFNIELQSNDIVLMASDGVFDNIPEDVVVDIVTSTIPTSSKSTSTSTSIGSASAVKSMLLTIAKKVAQVSRKVSLDPNAKTPYAILAKRNNQADYRNGLGGKVDDVSCIVARYA